MAYIETKQGSIVSSHHNFYAIMDFRTERELGLSDNDQEYLNTNNQYFTNGIKAIDAFLHSYSTTNYIATGSSMEELRKDMKKIVNNIKKLLNK